jgi:hypothetical protein
VKLWQVIVLALLPFAGNFGGGRLAELIQATEWRVSIALHAAAGILFAVIAVKLMPRTLENIQAWIVVLGFCIGGVLSILLKQLVQRLQAARGGSPPRTNICLLRPRTEREVKDTDGLVLLGLVPTTQEPPATYPRRSSRRSKIHRRCICKCMRS